MKAIEQAIEALEHSRDVIVERGLGGNPEVAEKWGLTLPLARIDAALAALRSMPTTLGKGITRDDTVHGEEYFTRGQVESVLRSMPAEPVAHSTYAPNDMEWRRKAVADAHNHALSMGATPPTAPVPFLPGEQERLTENGRKAWAGVDAQELREGGPALTTEEIDAIFNEHHDPKDEPWTNWRRFARAIEQAIGRASRGAK